MQNARIDRLMTVEETAQLLGMTVSTLNTWRSTKRNGPPYKKVGSAVRYSLRDVESWLEGRTIHASQE